MRHYYLYKITNLTNNKIYIGVHSTEDLNDDYFGSGTAIKSAIKKYGLSSFEKEILEFFESEEAMYLREAEVVDSVFVKRSDTYNETAGGRHKPAKLSTCIKNTIWITNGIEQKRIPISEAIPENWERGRLNGKITGYKWITDGLKSKRIPKETDIPVGWQEKSLQNRTKKMWITNGESSKYIPCTASIPDGYYPGRNNIYKRSLRWITNGLENRMIRDTDQLPINWNFGHVWRSQKGCGRGAI